jgi:hypothetical protein
MKRKITWSNCAADGVHEFMFVAALIPDTGAIGLPTSAPALK